MSTSHPKAAIRHKKSAVLHYPAVSAFIRLFHLVDNAVAAWPAARPRQSVPGAPNTPQCPYRAMHKAELS